MNTIYSGKVVVTGGAGFIGSALVWALNRRGIENILVVDRLRQGDKWKNLLPLRFADYWEADRFRSEFARCQDISCIFHLGACSSTTQLDCAYLIDNNYGYTQELARHCLEHQIRFVYASSAATYGDGSQGYSESVPLASLRPLNPYGFSKQIFDLHAERQGWLEHIVGLKYFNVFGPNEEHKAEMRSVVSKAFHQIRLSGRVQLFRSHHPDYRDGEQKRDFLYVKDAVAMTMHLAESGRGGLFNLGSGRASTWLELVEPIFAALGLPPQIEFVDMPEVLRQRYQYFTQADLQGLRASGYGCEGWSLSRAVEDYVANYLLPEVRLGDGPQEADLDFTSPLRVTNG